MSTRSGGTQTHMPRGTRAQQDEPTRLEERTTEELYALAGQLGIPGHMELSRPELIEAIRRR